MAPLAWCSRGELAGEVWWRGSFQWCPIRCTEALRMAGTVSNNGSVKCPDEGFPGNCTTTDREMLECCFSFEGKWLKNVGTIAFSFFSDELEHFVSAA